MAEEEKINLSDVDESDVEDDEVEPEQLDEDEDVEQEQMEDEEPDDEEEPDEEEEEEKKIENMKEINIYDTEEELDEDMNEESDDDKDYFQKFDDEIRNNYIEKFHTRKEFNNDEVKAMTNIVKDKGIIVDELHKTIPYLTKYEYTNILGIRAKQINEGSQPFVTVDKEIIDGYLIAQLEIKQKKLPFIIKRPLPNGGIEFWKLKDLEILS